MTDTSSLLTTYSLHSAYQVAPPTSVSPVLNGNLSPPDAPEEEEYTIKCICGYTDDDGNTVFCEKCDTWQHINCYYHNKPPPSDKEVHFCTDCAPKDTFQDLNADKARERQRRARELLEGGGDRKPKRPASKSQKKKHRDTVTNAELPNGWTNHERHESLVSARDQPPPAKKPKTSHRASGSVVSLNGEPRKRAHSNLQSYPSPSKSPQELYRHPIIPQYTFEFLDLYDRDDGNTDAKNNQHTIRAVHALSLLESDPSHIARDTEHAILTRTEDNWEERNWPSVEIETVHGKEVDHEGKAPTWKLLRLRSDVRKNTIVGEIRGQVGTLDEYCHQLNGPNRWNDLSHPDPFVFFHPHMDIYIDSRQSGTHFRYIRRSCDPNVTMRSYITADNEVHHCFIANKDIPAGSELTAIWYLPNHFLDKGQVFQERCDYISKVLANFGDCACGSPKCHLDQFDRRSSMRPPPEPVKPAVGRKKKNKTKQAISPLSTGQATNSRAGSETIKGQDEDDDHRSTSGSSRNGAQSRDLTPQGGALLDEPPVLGNGLTKREIRKIQALEKATQEQSHKGEKKQKKRPCGVSMGTTPNVATSKSSVQASSIDVKRRSGSPPAHRALKDVSNRSTPSRPGPAKQSRPIYVAAAVQTDPEPCNEQPPPLKRRKFCTPTQRLLQKLIHQRMSSSASSTSSSPEAAKVQDRSEDLEMKDASTSISTSPTTTKSTSTSPVLEMHSQPQTSGAPLPSQVAHTHKVHGVFKTPAPRLSLSTLPPVPPFPNTASTVAGASSATTPNATTPTIAQSPSAFVPPSLLPSTSSCSLVTPSPAKKKLSLGDYMRRKESATPSTEKPGLNLPCASDAEKDRAGSDPKAEIVSSPRHSSDAAPPDVVTAESVKAKSAINKQAIEDTPMPDVKDTMPTTSEQMLNQEPDSHVVSSEVTDVLSSLQQIQ